MGQPESAHAKAETATKSGNEGNEKIPDQSPQEPRDGENRKDREVCSCKPKCGKDEESRAVGWEEAISDGAAEK